MVPIIVLTGFLGSGKTTLLNRLFRERPPGRGRFAIVVNELGSMGIDGDLLPEEATRQVELPGGCICCALVEDLKTTLAELIESAPDLECIIIETTGVADPMPISWTLAAEPLGDQVRLAAVVTVVDPHHHGQSRRQSPSVDAQVRYADLIVVSKLDEAQLSDELRRQVRELNEIAPIIERPPDQVAAALWTYLDDPELGTRSAGPRREHAHVHANGDDGFESVAVVAGDTYDLEELVSALEELPPGVVRLKGIVRAIDAEAGATEPGLFVVHRVGARVSTEPFEGDAKTRVVAIGRGIDSIRLSACLASAVVT